MMWMPQSLANRSGAGFSAKQPRILEHLPNLALFLRMAFQPIENYGVIGNMQSVALVGMDGSIDFLCYPEFDSPTVFACLLDDKKGGSFQIRPQLTNVRVRQLYLPDTNILLTRFRAEGQQPEMELIGQRFQKTVRFWKTWIAQSNYKGRWREMVHRSALMLKLLISRKHGSLIAAPTFSLPEEIGGVRNWDYRFTWLRDAAFTLYALIRLGFVEEAEAFIKWIKGRLGNDAQRGYLQVMYGIDGRQRLDEVTLDHLSGYENSRPVRIGNLAYQQLQLDIYGEMMDSIYLANKYGHSMARDGWLDVQRMLAWLGENWKRPDNGIWEVRGGPKEFLHSRLMCWVAFDRALRLAEKRSFDAPFELWRRTRDEIRNNIFRDFWDEDLQSFVQVKGTKNLDASAMLMPMMRFISPVDPMWLSTMKAIEKRLVEDTLVYRYEAERTHIDGLPGGEGSFTACSFWYVECLARAGELEKAQLLFEKLLGYANHLGLYSEEIGSNGRHLGNFPQAFTHLTLISAATYLDRALSGWKGAVWR